MSGIVNSTGARSGVIGVTSAPPATVDNTGHIVQTVTTNTTSGAAISTTSWQQASGIIVTAAAATGSNYNFIHFTSTGLMVGSGGDCSIFLYRSVGGGGYANVSGSYGRQFDNDMSTNAYDTFVCTFCDPSPSTSSTNAYQIYYGASSSATTFYLRLNNHPSLMYVQEIEV